MVRVLDLGTTILIVLILSACQAPLSESGFHVEKGFPTGLSLDQSQLTLGLDDAPFTLGSKLTPANAPDAKIEWSSDDPRIVSVVDGVVTPQKVGTVRVEARVKTLPGTYVKRTVEVRVVGNVTTVAGQTYIAEYVDGTGSVARFSGPSGVVLDATGALIVFDRGNGAVRRVTPEGTVGPVAGDNPAERGADHQLGGNSFIKPWTVAVDGAGFVYVADYSANTIRKISPLGVVSTLAGLAYKSGSVDGKGVVARFNSPRGIAVDATGTVYVSDSQNSTIRKISPDGVVTTWVGLAGSAGGTEGQGSAARFRNPQGIALDSLGNLFVVDSSNGGAIRKVTPGGLVSSLAQGLSGNISAVAVDPSGVVYVNGGSKGTWSVASNGTITLLDDTEYHRGVTVNHDGDIYVSTYYSVRKHVKGSTGFSTWAGKTWSPGYSDGPGSQAQFNGAGLLAIDTLGNLYVPEEINSLVRKITPTSTVTTLAGLAGVSGSSDGVGQRVLTDNIEAVAMDGEGRLYFTDTDDHVIYRYSSDGIVTTLAGSFGLAGSTDGVGASARFNNPQGLITDAIGNLYVADTGNDIIRKITPTGVVTTLAGMAGVSGSIDGQGSSSRFIYPAAMAIDAEGNLYVVDNWNTRIRKISPNGSVTTLQDRSTGKVFTPDGARGIAVDVNGTVFVTEAGGSIVSQITSNGDVSVIAGKNQSTGSADGVDARFWRPYGLAIDRSGTLYISDYQTQTIRSLRTRRLP